MTTATDLPKIQPHNLEAEQSVLGAVLLDNAAMAPAQKLVAPEDFYSTAHTLIFRAMLELGAAGQGIDNIALTDWLSRKGALADIGGAAYLAELLLVVPSAENVGHHAAIVAERSRARRLRTILMATTEAIDNGADAHHLHDLLGKLREAADVKNERLPQLTGALVPFDELAALTLPVQKKFTAWLTAGGLAMVFGPRGIGKTHLQLALAAALTTGTKFLCWDVSEPVGVLYVDGEMPLDELRHRITLQLPTPPSAPLFFLSGELIYRRLERDLSLSQGSSRAAVTDLLDAHPEIRVVIIDNISTLFPGIDEDRKRDWEPIAGWLISLRRRGLAIVLVHHAGKGGQQRGTSGREDVLDTVIQLARPADYDPREGAHFELSFSKARGAKGNDVTPLDVKLEEIDGRSVFTWKPLQKSNEEKVRDLMAEGINNPADLAEEVGISRVHAYRLKRKIEAGHA